VLEVGHYALPSVPRDPGPVTPGILGVAGVHWHGVRLPTTARLLMRSSWDARRRRDEVTKSRFMLLVRILTRVALDIGGCIFRAGLVPRSAGGCGGMLGEAIIIGDQGALRGELLCRDQVQCVHTRQ
jgi:hypothetical protein